MTPRAESSTRVDLHPVIVDRNGKRLTYGDIVATRSGRQYTVRNWFGEGTWSPGKVLLEPYPTHHGRRSCEVPAASLVFIASFDLRTARQVIRRALSTQDGRLLELAAQWIDRAWNLGRDTPADIRATREDVRTARATLEAS